MSRTRPAARKPRTGPGLRPPAGAAVDATFFDRDAQDVAASLLGMVLCHRVGRHWLMASVVEAEAYYLEDKASHASLGFTQTRRALFMPPGTIYMYYARGGDSFNMSVRGAGNAVLFKAGRPLLRDELDPAAVARWPAREARAMLERMARLNPMPTGAARPVHRLCAGQTLLCRALALKVPDWNARPLPSPGLVLVDVGYRPERIVRARRLGIPSHRDPHHLYRFVDLDRVESATRPPLTGKAAEGTDFAWVRVSRH